MAQFCFGATFAIAAFSLGLQFIQDWLGVWDDPATVKPSHPSGYGVLQRYHPQANLLVVATSLSLAFMADRDGPCWRVVRLNALTGITITALVHWFLLHPLDDFRGLLWASDTLIHHRSGAGGAGLAVCSAAAADQRRRVVVLGLVWPVLWLLFTLVVGRITGWYPYFFLISHRPAPAGMALYCVAILILLFVVSCLFWTGDRWLPGRTPRRVAGDGGLTDVPRLRPARRER